jgi:hypothetical protein
LLRTAESISAPLDINTNPRHGRPAFNTYAFTPEPLGQLGNVPRRFFYGPGIYNFDMTLAKALPLTESKPLEFRVEAFNVFNHAQFYGPRPSTAKSTTPTSAKSSAPPLPAWSS